MERANFLEEILARRREQVAQDRVGYDFATLRARALAARSGKAGRFRAALVAGEGAKIIGEFKRASPSLGSIRDDADVAETVARYERAGVAAISVLTEPHYFRGSMSDLAQARAATALPILRKDFVVDEFQILEAAAAGADAVLLIVAALRDDELLRLRTLAEDGLGLDALVEVHDAEELRRANDCGASLLGVNNRDLRTFATSLETSLQLAPLAPAKAVLVSESGISTPEDIERLADCGYRGFLIGEALM
ncbi:MAG: indole-3-glycerol phosphate synthase TrpC, partial [Verrucomicrobiota bacterium]|nr:indole-3-glycerol phosphate synthase TrpC [Verrucomicrobiota bacterium]